MKSILSFDEAGNCLALKSDVVPLALLGETSGVTRVSHIVPADSEKRLAFLALRFLFGERGRVAEWARQWQGPWQVRWAASPGVVAFTHQSRRVCIDWEIDQIIQSNVSDMQRLTR
jgi:hypothetical protein